MRLRELLRDTRLTVKGPDGVDVTRIVNDSTKATPGSLFVAIKGIALDGHDFLAQAVARGAASLVVEDEARVPAGFAGAVVVVPDARAALNRLSGAFFGDPGRALFCVGVTGTDGKYAQRARPGGGPPDPPAGRRRCGHRGGQFRSHADGYRNEGRQCRRIHSPIARPQDPTAP